MITGEGGQKVGRRSYPTVVGTADASPRDYCRHVPGARLQVKAPRRKLEEEGRGPNTEKSRQASRNFNCRTGNTLYRNSKTVFGEDPKSIEKKRKKKQLVGMKREMGSCCSGGESTGRKGCGTKWGKKGGGPSICELAPPTTFGLESGVKLHEKSGKDGNWEREKKLHR